MLHNFAKSVLFVCLFNNVLAEVTSDGLSPGVPGRTPDESGRLMEETVREFERYAPPGGTDEGRTDLHADRGRLEEQYQQFADLMESKLDLIIELLQDPNNAYKFIEAKGVEKVIVRHVVEFSISFRMKILTIIQMLFELAPKATSSVLPMQLLDNLLEMYEDEDTLAIKGKIVEVLYAWLPGNPKAQARVMKMKGLDAFYDQIHKLDASIVETKLKLFSKILKEHIRVRKNTKQESKTDVARLNIYKRIGLIERMSTARVCIGLMNIFASFAPGEQPYMSPVLDLLIEIHPFCTGHFLKQTKAAQFFRDLEKHVKEMSEETMRHYEKQGLNVTVINGVVDKYVKAMKATRDEF